MHKSPDISIIIPCYNAADYLPACIDSLKNQSIGIGGLQFIFVDDASSDNTITILNNFEAEFPEQTVLLPLSKNQGQGFARNLAISYANGIYILYVDADDTLAPYALELLLQHASKLNCDMLEFDFIRTEQAWLNKSDAFASSVSSYQVTDHISRQIFCTSVPRFGTICNKLYRRELLIKHQIRNAEYLVHEDTLFSQLASLYTTHYAYLPVPLYFYRPNPDSTMLKVHTNDLHQFDRLQVQLQFLNECEQRGLLQKYYLAIECMFLRTYYIDTLLFVLQRFSTAPLSKLQEMQNTVLTCFPSWQNNPFLINQQTPLEQVLLSTLEYSFSEENFEDLKMQLQ